MYSRWHLYAFCWDSVHYVHTHISDLVVDVHLQCRYACSRDGIVSYLPPPKQKVITEDAIIENSMGINES